MNPKTHLIIAIDGHSSCGKSTVAKAVATHLNYTYIDSGAMYRAVTLFCMNAKLIKDNTIDEEQLRAKRWKPKRFKALKLQDLIKAINEDKNSPPLRSLRKK